MSSQEQIESTITCSRPNEFIDLTEQQYEVLPANLKNRIEIVTKENKKFYLTKSNAHDDMRLKAEIIVDKAKSGAWMLDMNGSYYNALNDDYRNKITCKTTHPKNGRGFGSFTDYYKK